MVVRPIALIGVVQLHLVAVDVEAFGGQEIRDVARRDRTVELAGFASRANHHEGASIDLCGHFLGIALALEIAGFMLRPLGFEALAVGLVGTKRLSLRQKEVAGEIRRAPSPLRPSGQACPFVREG